GLPGVITPRRAGGAADGAGLRFRDGVPAGGAGAALARDVRSGAHDLRGPAEPVSGLARYVAASPRVRALRPSDHFRETMNVVISGINHGQNMGEDVFYSGTVAAAMEGLVAGIPSIAVSYAGSDLELLETHQRGLRSLLKRIVEVKDFPKETLLNINLPALPGDQVKGVKVTHLGSRVFSEEIALMKDPWGKEIYWIGGGRINLSGDADSECRANNERIIS